MKTIPLALTENVDAKLTITSEDHVSVMVERDHPLTVNRVPLHGRTDLFRWDDGSWHQHPEWADGKYSLRSGYASSVYRADTIMEDASAAGANKFHRLITEAVEAWVRDSPWAVDELHDAGIEKRERDFKNLMAKSEDLEERARRLRQEAQHIQEGAKTFFYIQDYSSGHSETRKALRLNDGTTVDTVDQPGDR
jgi:hypothetical protein